MLQKNILDSMTFIDLFVYFIVFTHGFDLCIPNVKLHETFRHK